jgi:hypothetical protein
MIKEWLYFGCHKQPGHYIHHVGMFVHYDKHNERLTRFDALLAPQEQHLARFDALLAPQERIDPYVESVSRIASFGVSALSFWDYSIDSRQGSNSTFFCPSMTISEVDMLEEAKRLFPEVFNRLPKPVELEKM